MTRALLALALLLAACDTSAPLLEQSHRAGSAQRVNPDPCAGLVNPGITLGADEIAVADLCIAAMPEVDACFIALGDAPGAVEIWCEFGCGVTVDTTAVYPGAGSVRVELTNPCI